MSDQYEQSGVAETTDRGLFGFGDKKEEIKPQEEALRSQFNEKVQVSEEPEKKHESLLEKLHRSNSSSSSSSDEDEEVEEGGEKKKKKKKLKDKIKEKISGDDHKIEEVKKTEEYHHEADTSIPVERIVEPALEEKKGFLNKIKEKLPGGNKKTEKTSPVAAATLPAPAPPAPAPEHATNAAHEGEAKEKKGILEKIKEKIPGYHAKPEDEKDKEKEKHATSY